MSKRSAPEDIETKTKVGERKRLELQKNEDFKTRKLENLWKMNEQREHLEGEVNRLQIELEEAKRDLKDFHFGSTLFEFWALAGVNYMISVPKEKTNEQVCEEIVSSFKTRTPVRMTPESSFTMNNYDTMDEWRKSFIEIELPDFIEIMRTQ